MNQRSFEGVCKTGKAAGEDVELWTVQYNQGVIGRTSETDIDIEIHTKPIFVKDCLVKCHKESPGLTDICLAQDYPHIFWSLIYHCIPSKFGKKGTDVAENQFVADMMKDLCKDLNWEHMTRGGKVLGNRYGIIQDSNEPNLPACINNLQYLDLVKTVEGTINSCQEERLT